jgi:hypothetical protein
VLQRPEQLQRRPIVVSLGADTTSFPKPFLATKSLGQPMRLATVSSGVTGVAKGLAKAL